MAYLGNCQWSAADREVDARQIVVVRNTIKHAISKFTTTRYCRTYTAYMADLFISK